MMAKDIVPFTQLDTPTLTEVINQLEKDLQMSGNAYSFQAESPQDLIGEFSIELKHIDSRNGLNSLIYRVDVKPERAAGGADFYESLSILIWTRSLQKVWLRKNL